MSSPRKSTDCSGANDRLSAEDRARQHCLEALFHDWTGGDPYLTRQIQQSIEAGLAESGAGNDFAAFTAAAEQLREHSPGQITGSRAFVPIDFSGRTVDPLFARQEIVQQLKRQAGVDHLFLLVRGVRHGLFPQARRSSPGREAAYEETCRWITDLAREWITPECQLHLLLI